MPKMKPGIYCSHIDLCAVVYDRRTMGIVKSHVPENKVIETELWGNPLTLNLNKMIATVIWKDGTKRI